ncbi:hypothetical protein [Flavisphingomonas formosensis]|nr:hypothetical protein [Sphingomonas formosensis]
MIDTLSLAITHALLLIAAWRLIHRPDLNDDDAEPIERGFVKREQPPRA